MFAIETFNWHLALQLFATYGYYALTRDVCRFLWKHHKRFDAVMTGISFIVCIMAIWS